jgi:hypothetical protein
LLGSKVIKLNKIKESQTIGVQICSPLKTWRELSFPLETSGYRLKPKSHLKSIAKKSASA